ncbi:MAG: efflux transporter periplasmic adaptor subunit [Verrucomicrobia bacterium]|nr:MAG: efflux transporter periplasmic adaptor subunit [Verrucomicrobiota bacterium]
MKLNKKTTRLVLVAATLVLVAFVGGRLTGKSPGPVVDEHAGHAHAGPEIWTCSMHPQIQLPKPGKCPICMMDLIPLEAGDDEGGGEREIRISPYSAKLMELETAEVTRHFAAAEIRMVGKVDYDETRVSTISAWVPGRLDRLFVDYTGVPVQKGDHLAEIYSPDLLTAQEELIQAIQTLKKLKNSDSTYLLETAEKTIVAAREKLRLWGFTAEQIAKIENRGIPNDHMTIYSAAAGIVIHKNAQEGMYVKTGTRIYTIADLSTVWIQLDAYESDLNGLRQGGTIEFTTETYPGKTFAGTISFIDPIINPATRTAKVRVIVENENGKLKPGMFVRAVARPKMASSGRVMDAGLAGKWISPMHPEIVKDGPGSCDVCGMPLVTAESLGYVAETEANAPLLIPVTAALKTGKRAVVYVELPDREKPSYEGREVRLGQRLGNFYIVEEGLEEGERVVTRGAFKLDAELQIRAKPSMMSAPSEDEDMSEMDHSTMPAEILPEDVPEAFAQQLEAAVLTYFDIQLALGGDSAESAKTATDALKEKLQQIDMGLLEGDGHMVWMEHFKNLNATTIKLQKASSIETQRAAFYSLSQQLALTLRTFPIQLPVQQAFCPMAFDDAGAIWLQKSSEIINPYFGEMMLKCGEIQEVIGANHE